jgi:hypothetical protein
MERFPKGDDMVFPLVVGGLFAVAFGISRLRAKRGAKPDVQTLFNE